MSQVYFISDLHIGHHRICEFSGPTRGNSTTVEEHDAWIVKQWNSVITKKDLVYILGDICFDKRKISTLAELKGTKHLILGNHDEMHLDVYAKYFNKIHGFMKYKKAWLSHAPIHPDELRGKVNFHGHVHHKSINDNRYVNVCVEALGGIPRTYDELIKACQLPV